MVCPFCLHKKTEVYNSRPTKRINGFWRRRRCQNCQKEFTTRETIDAEVILRVTSATSKKPVTFSRPRLLISILRACDHQRTQTNAYWLCDTIEQKLIALAAPQNGVLTTEDIVTVTLGALKRFDTPAFIKYLTHHAPTIDAKTLKKQLKQD